jgi:general secretion pathway protein E
MENRNNAAWIYLILSVLILAMILLSSGYRSHHSSSMFHRLLSPLNQPVVLSSMILVFLLLMGGFVSTLLQSRRDKQISKRVTISSAEQVSMPIRIHQIPTGNLNITPERLSDVSNRIKSLARRGDSGVIDFLDFILTAAIELRASDIHIEPSLEEVKVKFRTDGSLQNMGVFPLNLLDRIISRIRVLANLTIYERGKPQDGRINLVYKRDHYDVRLSTIPTLHGEKAVIRLFESADSIMDLSSLGMTPDIYSKLAAMLVKPQGTILLTGPTGSGKTTTIYASIRYILDKIGTTANIVTIEDPIECELAGINQTQVNSKRDLTFAAGLRSILRQDPDVIMVGEIRDKETAEICTQAGLTGHLVISSIHASSSAGVFNRLIEMGIEPFLLASSVTCVLAQRLVRLNCPYCSKAIVPPLKALKSLTIPLHADMKFMQGEGCEKCNFRGFSGRTGIFEFLNVTPGVKKALQGRLATSELISIAREDGFMDLKESGIQKVKDGLVHINELTRVTG